MIGGMTQVVECLPTKCKTLSLNTNITHTQKRKKRLQSMNWVFQLMKTKQIAITTSKTSKLNTKWTEEMITFMLNNASQKLMNHFKP
jgi:hypothetical protein